MKKIIGLITVLAALLNALIVNRFMPPEPVAQAFPAAAVEGPVTTYQTGGGYTDALYIPTDSVMVYTLDPANYANWAKKSDVYTIDMMIAINRADISYVDAPPGHRGEVQTRKDGSPLTHGSSPNVFYMIPTESFIDRICEQLEACLRIKASRMIALEEPEIFDDAGYSAAFKAEWRAFFGEEWTDPASSPAARYKAAKLKVHLFERAITQIAQRVKTVCPETKICIATHSTVNYDNYGITAGIDHYAKLPGVDGIIGLTWSDTARMPLKYDGASETDVYSYAALEYASYMDTVEDLEFYALADPKADNPNLTWGDYETLYRHTIAASLMQPEINRFEVLPWPDRSFFAAPDEYKTEQLNVFAALERVSGKASVLRAGTARVALGISDTMSWLDETASKEPLQALEGLAVPLIKDGIPLKTKSLDFIDDPADLADVDLLILSYEAMKPQSERTNEAVARWVKDGGTVLYIGGRDALDGAKGEWWSAAGSPFNDLLGRLGLADIQMRLPQSLPGFFRWTGDGLGALDKARIEVNRLRLADADANAAFTGDINTVLKSGCDSVGIDQSVEEGRFIAFGFPAYLTSKAGGAGLTRALVKYALGAAGSAYNKQNLVQIRRGDIVGAHAFDRAAKIEGTFIDLFDSELGVVNGAAVEKGGSALLLDIAGLDLTVPRLAFTGGRPAAAAEETAEKTAFTVTGPAMADISSRFVCAKGVYPQSVSVLREGRQITPYIKWDKAASSLLLQYEGSPAGVSVEVTWSNSETDISNEKPPSRIVIPANNQNLDAAYLYKNTAFANDGLRFADGATEIVYKFDPRGFQNPEFTLHVCQNYLIDVSTDGVNFTVTHDYSLINPVHLTTGGNDALLTFDPDDYGARF